MKSVRFYFLFVLVTVFLLETCPIFGQTSSSDPKGIEKTILELDHDFWQAYNACDLVAFRTFLSEELEFYHDKGGLTEGLNALMKSVGNGLCSAENGKTRRAPIEGSVKVFPMANYGAFITGEHLFYYTAIGGEEQLVGVAKFSHLWQLKDDQWKMSRVISYDHQEVSINRTKVEVTLSNEELLRMVGTYKGPNTGIVNILKNGDVLEMKTEGMSFLMYPESPTLFYVKEAPLTLEFMKESNQFGKFIVRENGNIVEEAIRIE